MNHMVLCSKGWYHHSENLWEDYRRCICCDCHYQPYSRHDVAYLMLKFINTHVDKIDYMGLNIRPEERMTTLYRLIRDKMDLLLFYENRHNPGKEINPFVLYDDATILACHGILQSITLDKFDLIYRPSANVLPLTKWRNETKLEMHLKICEKFKGCKPYDDEIKSWFIRNVTKKSLGEEIAEGRLTYKNQHNGNKRSKN